MITGTHAIIYSDDADATRAFFRDVLQFPYVDAQGGWLIFKAPPAELGVHPVMEDSASSGHHEVYLMCDDIRATVDELRAKGVEFTSDVSDQGFGLVTTLALPGGGELGLYEPRHPTAFDLDA